MFLGNKWCSLFKTDHIVIQGLQSRRFVGDNQSLFASFVLLMVPWNQCRFGIGVQEFILIISIICFFLHGQ